ncbi:hypothetical protein [Micromonospora siamensis]|uniref:Secreted protein n=1 Tax=Micromonospora siamensis TaxID=299152 RepID=A0A1C5GLN8_9ACTN|nr:hypothetical protein [Micromonospora siamensis]SCG34669.1 hypothetical protein GA0074704_0108 [Micromonospora siamensis]
MAHPFRSRVVPLSAAVLLAATTLTACSLGPARRGGAVAAPAVSGTGAGSATDRVSLVQKLGSDGPLRTLNVAADGRWECDDCAGDGVSSTGALDPDQVQRLHRLLADPRLAGETDQSRQYRASCIDALTSSLVTAAGLITSQDCPGEERPPVANEILLLLTQATPAEPTA